MILLRFLLAYGLLIALLFGSAGRWDVSQFWVYLGMFATFSLTLYLAIVRKDPGLLRERVRWDGQDADKWTRPLALPLFVGHLVVAGLDVGRYHWSDGIPVELRWMGFLILGIGMVGWGWPMSVNRFFSAQVRIQEERGHQVVDAGPYRFVRHPGYLAFLVLYAGSPLALGSYVSALPCVAMMLVVLRRTALEDRFLRANLPGYQEYSTRVRYRLIPGIW